MIEGKDLLEAEQNLPHYLEDGLLTKNKSYAQFAPFYLKNAEMSFHLASFLHKLSTNNEVKKKNDFPENYECLLWVVVASYYSMFYIANAALAKLGLKVSDKIPHKVTQDALLVYFLKNNRLAKSLLEDYKEAKMEVMGLMNVSEEELLKEFQLKAKEIIATFDYQRRKRGEFQYEIKVETKEHVARLSLERAKRFIQEMKSALDKIS